MFLPLNVQAAAKHRTDDDWVVDDAMMSVKRSRMKDEKEKRKSRNSLIKGTLNRMRNHLQPLTPLKKWFIFAISINN